ncbi:MAG: hypothetical protein ACYSVY_20615 [Planctomycetota bacterium]|jgi:hypothetical protein
MPCYDIHGALLRVTGDTAYLQSRVDVLLGPFRCAERQGAFRFDLRQGLADEAGGPPAADERLRRRALPGGIQGICAASDGVRQIVVPGATRLMFDTSARRALLEVAPGAEERMDLVCLLPALSWFLALYDHHLVHAAALHVQPRGVRAGVLISAPGGRGKTTTALALARDGFRLMADDAAFVTGGGQEKTPVLWGLPRPCKIHERTAALLPWLKDLDPALSGTFPERPLAVGRLPGADPLGEAAPRLVLFLEPPAQDAHQVRPLDKLAAVSRLVNENVRASTDQAYAPADRAFRALTRLAGRCGTYLLRAGPDLESLGATVRELIRKHEEE